MPFYDFECQVCGRAFDELVSRHDEKAPCPACGSGDVKKLLSPFSTPKSGSTERAPAGPCGSCGNPGGPGSCRN